tara:strand:- start:11493 stop:11675 length:183 start_codon:yes stop_codon:yes gene_type:complete
LAGWQSGYAAACKAVYSGSIPDSASIKRILEIYFIITCKIMRKQCPGGGIGRHKGLKIPR